MKSTGTCPKCRGRRIYVISPVRAPDQSRFDIKPMPLVACELRGHAPAIGGTHALYVCAGCGFEEWYAEHFQELLETLLDVPESGVRVIDATSPYR